MQGGRTGLCLADHAANSSPQGRAKSLATFAHLAEDRTPRGSRSASAPKSQLQWRNAIRVVRASVLEFVMTNLPGVEHAMVRGTVWVKGVLCTGANQAKRYPLSRLSKLRGKVGPTCHLVRALVELSNDSLKVTRGWNFARRSNAVLKPESEQYDGIVVEMRCGKRFGPVPSL